MEQHFHCCELDSPAAVCTGAVGHKAADRTGNVEAVVAADVVDMMVVVIGYTLDGAVGTVAEVDSVEDEVLLLLLRAVLLLQAFETLVDRHRIQQIDD